VKEKRVVFSKTPAPKKETSTRWNSIMADIKANKNLSPRFTSATDAIAWLKKLAWTFFHIKALKDH
jgi:hypothetical protein